VYSRAPRPRRGPPPPPPPPPPLCSKEPSPPPAVPSKPSFGPPSHPPDGGQVNRKPWARASRVAGRRPWRSQEEERRRRKIRLGVFRGRLRATMAPWQVVDREIQRAAAGGGRAHGLGARLAPRSKSPPPRIRPRYRPVNCYLQSTVVRVCQWWSPRLPAPPRSHLFLFEPPFFWGQLCRVVASRRTLRGQTTQTKKHK